MSIPTNSSSWTSSRMLIPKTPSTLSTAGVQGNDRWDDEFSDSGDCHVAKDTKVGNAAGKAEASLSLKNWSGISPRGSVAAEGSERGNGHSEVPDPVVDGEMAKAVFMLQQIRQDPRT